MDELVTEPLRGSATLFPATAAAALVAIAIIVVALFVARVLAGATKGPNFTAAWSRST